MEYKPKARHSGLRTPFGYYVCPTDPTILIPDPKKLDCLHYAFRMRAKYKTPYRDCTQWLHANTGQLISAAGFMYAYKHWVKKLKKENGKEVALKRKALLAERQKIVDEQYRQFGIRIDDKFDIDALAANEAKKQIRKKAEISAG